MNSFDGSASSSTREGSSVEGPRVDLRKTFISHIGRGSSLDDDKVAAYLQKKYLPSENPLLQLLFLTELMQDKKKIPLTKKFLHLHQRKKADEEAAGTLRKSTIASTVVNLAIPFLPLALVSTLEINQIMLTLLFGVTLAVVLVSSNTINNVALGIIAKNQNLARDDQLKIVAEIIEMREHFERMGDALLSLHCKKDKRRLAGFIGSRLDMREINTRMAHETSPKIADFILGKFNTRFAWVSLYKAETFDILLNDYLERKCEPEEILKHFKTDPIHAGDEDTVIEISDAEEQLGSTSQTSQLSSKGKQKHRDAEQKVQ